MNESQRNPLEFLTRLVRDHGDVVQYSTAYGTIYFFNHPAHIQEVLHRPNLRRTSLVKMALGEGLLSSDGPYWRRQRQLMQPRFRRESILEFAPLVNEITSAALKRWQVAAEREQTFDLAPEMTRLTLEVVVRALFSNGVADEAVALGDAITTIMEDLGHIAATIFLGPGNLAPSRNTRFTEALATIDDIVYRMIHQRRRENDPSDDLLSLLVDVQDGQDGAGFSDRQLRDEIVTMLISGHETTSLILSWACFLLAGHRAVERRLLAEIDRQLAGRLPTVDDLAGLSYCRMVLEETMRLYPPVWFIVRQAQDADQIGGCAIPAGAVIVVSPYTVHRHASFWDDPERFDPQRFQPDRSAARQRGAYLPFGGGRHTCLGNHFAMMEGVLVLARTFQEYRVRLAPGRVVEPQPVLTLRQRHGLPVILSCRASCQPSVSPAAC